MLAWVVGFLTTLAFEIPATLLMLGTSLYPPSRVVVASLLVNLATHPLAWLLVLHSSAHYWTVLPVAELVIIAVEGVGLRVLLTKTPLGRALLVSAAANTLSCLGGMLVLSLVRGYLPI
jgi:hypothetical protein